MIAIIDYGVGNLFSISASLTKLNIEHIITSDIEAINSATHLILPGVGAFSDAMMQLKKTGLDKVVIQMADKKPILGICLGMQLLFDRSFEFGVCEGLGLILGEVVPIKNSVKDELKVPHMGWNKLVKKNNSKILKYIGDNDYVYFVHSFYVKTEDKFISSISEYDIDITASVEHKNIYGTQFHPEKSGSVGLSILKAFYEI